MELALIRPAVVLETLVLLFQVVGVGGLLLSRVFPSSRWAARGKIVVMGALIGLALAGSICSPVKSGMGLFAGGTITVLLVGMISGGSAHRAIDPTVRPDVIDHPLAA